MHLGLEVELEIGKFFMPVISELELTTSTELVLI